MAHSTFSDIRDHKLATNCVLQISRSLLYSLFLSFRLIHENCRNEHILTTVVSHPVHISDLFVIINDILSFFNKPALLMFLRSDSQT